MSVDPLDVLQAAAEEEAELAALDAVIDPADEQPTGDLPVDPEAALEQLHREPDPEIGSPWRRAS
jgi:hypothetical protein